MKVSSSEAARGSWGGRNDFSNVRCVLFSSYLFLEAMRSLFLQAMKTINSKFKGEIAESKSVSLDQAYPDLTRKRAAKEKKAKKPVSNDAADTDLPSPPNGEST